MLEVLEKKKERQLIHLHLSFGPLLFNFLLLIPSTDLCRRAIFNESFTQYVTDAMRKFYDYAVHPINITNGSVES